MASPKWPSLRRYGELSVVAIGGATVLALTGPYWTDAIMPVVAHFDAAPYAFWLSCLLLVIVACWKANKPLSALLGVRHFCKYPPGWVASFVGATSLQAFWVLLPESRPRHMPSTWDGVSWTAIVTATLCTCGIVANLARSWWVGRGKSVSAERWDREISNNRSAIATDLLELRKWIEDDEPILGLHTDQFDLRSIARRIVQRLTTNDPLPTIAIVGRLGAGKSSLLQLVDEGLSCRIKSPELISLSLWQYETTHAAAAGILDTLLGRVSQHINITGLTGLSAQYITAIEGSSGLTGSLLRAVLGRKQPTEVLRALDPVIAATGVHFVLWVEDLERFAHEEDQRGPIRALLYQLDQRPHVSVILATTTLETGFDIEKLARYVERIPDLKQLDVFRILRTFRSGSVSAVSLQPKTKRSRRPLEFRLTDEDDWTAAVEKGSDERTVPGALAALCRTPRELKQALRRCSIVWEGLRGEIDFDDVLIMSMIRETNSQVFSLIDEYAVSLRMGEPSMPGAEEDEQAKETLFQSKLAKLLENHSNAKDILRLVNFVFPRDRDDAPPQGMRSGARNYWMRFQAVPEIGPMESDRALFALLSKFQRKEEDGEALARYLTDAPDEAATLVFAEGMNAGALRLLLSLVVNQLMLQHPMPRDDEGRPAGILIVWNLFQKLRKRGEHEGKALAAIVPDLTGKCLPQNMFLAEQVVRWFGEHDGGEYDLVPFDDSERVMAAFHVQLIDNFGTSPSNPDAVEKLVTALRGAPEVMLGQAVWGIPKIRRDAQYSEPPFNGWESFRDTILSAAERAPDVMLGPIAWMVAKHLGPESRDRKDRASFKQDAAERLFGATRLLEIFKTADVSVFAIDQTETVYRCVKRAATDARVREGSPYGEGDET